MLPSSALAALGLSPHPMKSIWPRLKATWSLRARLSSRDFIRLAVGLFPKSMRVLSRGFLSGRSKGRQS